MTAVVALAATLTACGDAIRQGAASRFGAATGALARGVFLTGVWAAVATSMLGVWQGVPYLCADLLHNLRGLATDSVDPRGVAYRMVLAWLAARYGLKAATSQPRYTIGSCYPREPGSKARRS